MVKNSLNIILLFISIQVIAQHSVPFSYNNRNDVYGNFEKDQIKSLFELYSQKIDLSYELINGRAYFPYYFRSHLKPILFFERDHSSSVTLKGIKYDDVYLDYDTYTDEVIYIDSSRFCIYIPLRVALDKDYVDCFEFYYDNDTVSFRYFSKDADPFFDLKDGYYEVVSDSDSKYLIKHYSVFEEKTGIVEYINIQDGYVNIGNGFSKIINKRQFIRLFGDRMEEVRKYIENSEINIRKANKKQIICVLNYYDSIKKQIK